MSKDNKSEEQSTLHWAFSAAKKTAELHGKQNLFTCQSGVTPSGTIHVGNFREIITIEIVNRAFNILGMKSRHLHSWDDYDVFRKVPPNMPEQDRLKTFLRSPITETPDTYDCNHSSFAEHNKSKVLDILPKVGINPEYISQTEKYQKCDYAEELNYCLKNTDKIISILNKYRKEPLKDNWLPVSIFCDKCKKDTTTKIEYQKDYTIYYECKCGFSETFDIRKKGIIKLNYRIDWPMRWHYEKVHFEPAGKDHFAAGGTRDTAIEIQKELWDEKAPYGFMYEWIGIKGGKQFSSSTGVVKTVQDVLEIYEPEIIRYLFASTRPGSGFDISFDLDVIKIYEDWDRCERIYYNKEEVTDKEKEKNTLIYQLSQIDKNISKIPKEMSTQIQFKKIVNTLNIKGMDKEKTYNELKDNTTNEKQLKTRIQCAKNWIEKYAGDNFRFTVNKEKYTKFFDSIDEKDRQALSKLKEVIQSSNSLEDLETAIFNIPKEMDMGMKDFFKLAYVAIINKERGPKLAGFICEIGKEKVLELL